MAQSIATPHTSPTKACIGSGMVPYTHFQGWSRKKWVITSKGVLQQKPLTIPKNIQVGVNSKGDQEPINKRTRSNIDSKSLLTIQAIQPLNEPIAARKISHTLSQKYTTLSHSRALAAQLLTHVANSVLDHDTGKQLNYGKLRKNKKFQETLNKSFSNEIGRLFQVMGTGENGIGKIVEGTDISHVITFEDISKDRINKICYTSVVCEVIPGNKYPNRARITICGTNVCYPGYVGTNIASLELFNLMINSILSIVVAKYVCFDIEHFYLSTPLGRPEYMKIQLSKIPQ